MYVCVCEYAVRNDRGAGRHADPTRSVPLDDVAFLYPDVLCVCFCLRNGVDSLRAGCLFPGHSVFVFRIYADMALSDTHHLPRRTAPFHQIRVRAEIEPDVLLYAHDPVFGNVRNVAGYSGTFDVRLFRVDRVDGGNHRFQENAGQVYTLFLRV